MNKSSNYHVPCFIASFVLFFISIILLNLGIDKLTNYSCEYPLHNCYVGGDAYNYIINGVTASSYFIVASCFTISGVILLCFAIYSYSKSKHEYEIEFNKNNAEKDIIDNLPNL